ncbi:MAG: hypothetical protein P8Z79_17900, partial [Sedimentisphaerales bacterium]
TILHQFGAYTDSFGVGPILWASFEIWTRELFAKKVAILVRWTALERNQTARISKNTGSLIELISF